MLELSGDSGRAAIHLAESARLDNHTDDFQWAADALLRCGQAHRHLGKLAEAISGCGSSAFSEKRAANLHLHLECDADSKKLPAAAE